MRLSVIGDDIFADGELVGRLCVTGVSASLLAEVKQRLHEESTDAIDDALASFVKTLREKAKGGLLRLSELEEVYECL